MQNYLQINYNHYQNTTSIFHRNRTNNYKICMKPLKAPNSQSNPEQKEEAEGITFSSLCSVTQLCPTLCNSTDCSMPGFPVHHQLLEPAQTHVHWVSDAIQPPHPLSSLSPPAFSLSKHQRLFQWVSSLHQVARVLELQLQSFQWIFRTDFL